MNTEIYIENRRADVSTDISALLTFAVDDPKEFGERTTTFSKTIVLPGTANNNKLFGHIFQVGQANNYNAAEDNISTNYNAAKYAACAIFQDQMQTFKGEMRLMEIVIDKGRPEYEVAIFGELTGLNAALSSSLLEDLDFSAYDHTWDYTNIINSWDATPGTGYYYPLIDYGTYSTLKKDWDIRTFRPALYVKEYIDKMFEAAGYRYSSDLFDTARFKGLIIPHNQKKIIKGTGDSPHYRANASSFSATISTSETSLEYDSTAGSDFTVIVSNIEYQGSTSYFNLFVNVGGIYDTIAGMVVTIYKVDSALNETVLYTQTFSTSSGEFNMTFEKESFQVNFEDSFRIGFTTLSAGVGQTIDCLGTFRFNDQSGTSVIEVTPGATIEMNYTIPKNIRQVDFLVSIVKLFNLYVYEDRQDSRLIHLTPYADFYSTDQNNSVDWSYKLNRDKPIRVKPMSELNAKKYEFKFRPDSDYYNELYKKRFNEGYGDYTFDSEFEFSQQTKSLELIFSATPLVGYAGEEKIYSTIFKRTGNEPSITEENIDSNIRIMQSKKITGVASWDIKNGDTVLTSVTNYGYAGHFDDPHNISNDLNFGALKELFFVFESGDLSKKQFNIYWSTYCAEITDKDSKLVSAYFYLTTKDIVTLAFQKKIYIDGTLYKLSKIEDYNVTSPSDCKVQLLKINYLLY